MGQSSTKFKLQVSIDTKGLAHDTAALEQESARLAERIFNFIVNEAPNGPFSMAVAARALDLACGGFTKFEGFIHLFNASVETSKLGYATKRLKITVEEVRP